MFSMKATKIDEIFTFDLRLCSKRHIDGEDFVNFCGLLRKHERYYKFLYLESFVQHFISLVQNEHFDAPGTQGSASNHVKNTTRCT